MSCSVRVIDSLQTLLPGRSNEKVSRKTRQEEGEEEDKEERLAPAHRMFSRHSNHAVTYLPLATKLYSQHKVRTSLHDRTLESMIPVLNPSRSDGDDVSKKVASLRDIHESACDLTSILELRKSVQKSVHHGLSC